MSADQVRIEILERRKGGEEVSEGKEDTVDGPNCERPCPWVTCRHHLYLDISADGSIKVNFPGVEVEDLEESCSLDVADRGENTLKQVGDILDLTRERIRQIESRGILRLRRSGVAVDP